MKKQTRNLSIRSFLSLSLTTFFLNGCTIRAIAVLETEDAVYGNTKVEKVQKYDPKQHHLGVAESVMGTFNSDTINALSNLVNGGPPAPSLPPPAPIGQTTVTPVPPGTSVIVQP